jgi:DNA-binding transcriptional LysR family regulator
MLRLGGGADGPQPLRLGISNLLVREFLQQQSPETLLNLVIHTDHSVTITKGVHDGFIDIACIFDNREIGTEIADLIVKEQEESVVWVRSKNFVLRPGSPIPILVAPGDDLMIRTLTRNGLQYRIVFNSHDFHARLSGIEAGMGVAAIPEKLIPPFLVRAREYYLPDLPALKVLRPARPRKSGSVGASRAAIGIVF